MSGSDGAGDLPEVPHDLTRHKNVRESVERAQQVAERTDGILRQIVAGSWDEKLDDAAAAVLARRIDAMTETVRLIRATAGTSEPDERPTWPASGEGLPINRKERFWTGTVLPAIITTPQFANLDLFLTLCGLPPEAASAATDGRSLELYSEYNLTESTFTAADRQRFPDVPTTGDTPDLIVTITGHDGERWLLAVEAKMFHTPGRSALAAQLRRQAAILGYLQRTLRIDDEHVRHVLLVPKDLNVGTLRRVTWEDVLAAYAGLAPSYWTTLLARGLHQYAQLRSAPTVTGKNADAFLAGADIVAAHADGSLGYSWVGCNGGVDGQALREAIKTGAWRTTSYQVSVDQVANRNWFPVGTFISKTAEA